MPKFFVDPEQIKENEIIITGSDVNHIKNVLRLSEGKEILINDRQGYDYKCIIKLIDIENIRVQILEKTYMETEPTIETILFQSLIKGERMEWVIQKAVEIGVTKIVPLVTERCVVKFENSQKIEKKIERWNKISESAAKQSRRGIIPEVVKPMPFKEAISYAVEHLDESCIPFEHEVAYSIKKYLKSINIKRLGIFIGPEGGFTDEEILEAEKAGIVSVTLGKRILRSETAGMLVLANVMYEMGGDF